MKKQSLQFACNHCGKEELPYNPFTTRRGWHYHVSCIQPTAFEIRFSKLFWGKDFDYEGVSTKNPTIQQLIQLEKDLLAGKYPITAVLDMEAVGKLLKVNHTK